jgi:hypothetical protein
VLHLKLPGIFKVTKTQKLKISFIIQQIRNQKAFKHIFLFFQRYGAMAAGGAAADLEMVDNPDLGRDLVPVHQPVMPFSIEENQLIENLIKVELGTSEIIPVPINVMQSLIQVTPSLSRLAFNGPLLLL